VNARASLILTVIAASMQTPAAPQTAGERYKSVQVLRDIPSDLVIPTMAFMANSLGVTCAHCHGSEWVSDEKPAKQRAREMIRLTQAINREHYQGKSVVTCQTCHDGRVVPAATPRVEEAGWNKKPAPPVPPLPRVEDVFTAYIRGAGGETALQAAKNRLVTGTVTRFNGRSAAVSGPFQLYQEATAARLSTELSHPPEGDAEVNASFARPMLTAKNYTDARVVATDRIRNHDVIVVSAKNPRGVEHRLFFDAGTGLLLRRTDEIPTALGALPEQYDLDDYRAVDGVMVPHSIQWSRADYQVTFTFETVKHNVPPPE
jgi:Photosynthetic reaction centre cytochrome C subunit